jgi:hypothetical protein
MYVGRYVGTQYAIFPAFFGAQWEDGRRTRKVLKSKMVGSFRESKI